jgi:transcriptional regulator
MHPNPAFRQTPTDRNLAFARARGFGVLAVNGATGPILAHVPFLLSEDGREAEMHLVRSNPIARALAAPLPAAIAVSGPDGYVSPDWYEAGHDQVPTWNYVAVHLRGQLLAAEPETMRAHLDRVSARFEADLAPKRPWTVDKMPDEVLERMMRQIVPCRFVVEQIDGTWKLNQNKPDAARLLAAEAMAASPVGQETAALARLMRSAGT